MLFKTTHTDIAQGLLILLGSLFVYTTVSTYQLVGDARPNELIPISIIREGNLDFNEFALIGGQLPYYFKEVNGRRVSAYSPMPGFLNVPTYLVADMLGQDIKGKRFILSHWTTCILCSLSALFLWGTLRKLDVSPATSLLSTFAYCFATPVWSSASVSLWQHSSSLFLLNAPIYLLLTKNKVATVLAGLLLGAAFWCRPTNLFFLLGCVIYIILLRRREILQLSGGLILAAIPYCWYSVEYLGNVRAARHASIYGVDGFGGDWLMGAAGLLISPSRGLFAFSPILLLALLGRSGLKQLPPDRRGLVVAIATSSFLLFAITAKWSFWWGGASYGPRLLCEIVPALIIFLALSWKIITKHRTLTALSGILLCWSVYSHFLGARYYPCGFNSEPVMIDQAPERLWHIRGSQIEYCVRESFNAGS
ncbi:MAG: hypothetical protein PHC51_10355 [bacterium]|nr:hypothetical protein [bacterium]